MKTLVTTSALAFAVFAYSPVSAQKAAVRRAKRARPAVTKPHKPNARNAKPALHGKLASRLRNRVPQRPRAQSKLRTQTEALAIAKQYRATVAIFGHGSASQFKSMAEVKKALGPMVARLNAKHGRGGWLAVFGGDPYNAEKPDIAHVLKWLKDEHGVPLMAFQSDIVDKQWGGVDKHIDYVHYVRTDKTPKDATGKRDVLWGGVRDGKLVGATKGYLGPRFAKALSGVIAVGGGPIALQEVRHAQSRGVSVKYVAAEARNPSANGRFGPLHEWSKGNSQDEWLE